MASPQINSNSNSLGFYNNSKTKFNPIKYRMSSPMIKSKNYKRPPLTNRCPKNPTNKSDKFR